MMRANWHSRGLLIAVALLATTLQGCKGEDGKDGAPGADGADGTNAPPPPTYYTVFNGSPVSANNGISLNHGTAFTVAQSELEGAPANPKFLANITITGASVSAQGIPSVNFTVMGKDGVTPVTNLTAASAGIFKLVPAGGGLAYNRWVPYIYRAGRTVNAGYRENNTTSVPLGTLTNNGAGSYTYTFGTDLDTASYLFPIGGVTLVGYEPALTHRVSIYLGGHAGPTGEADFDFVPDGVTAPTTRDIVQTATCKKCHGWDFHGHGGDRVTVEGCVTCHSPFSAMVNTAANGGTTETIEMAVMIHKMHAGRELASAPGADGVFFDDPTTVANEAADNGTYTVGSITATWRSAAFPAGIENCTACHTGTGADVDNWMTVPSRAACGSCHDLIDWTTGTNHAGGAATNDTCTGCHPATGTGFGQSVTTAHDWTAKDIRNIPEFDVALTVSAPANGTHFVAGEAPVVTVVLSDPATGTPIDHTTVVEDPAAEGCAPNATLTACTATADGLFRNANMYVTGPRAKRIPVLTTAARAKVASATTGPWDLSAGGASLRVSVDGGNIIIDTDHIGEDVLMPGDFTVTLPAAGSALNALFANPAAATADEVVAWLNGSTATFTYNERDFRFSERAIAYVEGGKVTIRTRALGSFNPSVQIPDTNKGLAGMFTDTAIKVAGSAVQLRARTTASNNDPKAVRTAANITYTLDPVDDLVPGTYMVNVEFADMGRISTSDYRTPSIAVATFQVKQSAVEAPIAGSCTSCHWSTDAVGQGVGFVLDPVRHNKPFNAQAVDQCGGCHNYKSGETSGTLTWTTGGGTKPISKRVHAVHNGAALNFPVLTVDHEESVVGRNWRITYPQDVRNCESCHPATMSGTWATIPGRLACMGCHDATVATTHIRSQVYDPTPWAPWSGDESEACAACH